MSADFEIAGLQLDTDALLDALTGPGYYVVEQALEANLLESLRLEAQAQQDFRQAGIGRGGDALHNIDIRSDRIAWMDGRTAGQSRWLQAMDTLQRTLNRALYLGLFSFESHYAHYAPGKFYQTHRDAFRGQSNRRLSLVTYLNENWQEDWGGELVLYNDQHAELERVIPKGGTMVIFLSEEFPHEVLPATRDRFSIAGWFRVNSSSSGRIDPPV